VRDDLFARREVVLVTERKSYGIQFYVERHSAEPPQNHVHLQFLDDRGHSVELGGGKGVTDKTASELLLVS
jgi:hypothetical protein